MTNPNSFTIFEHEALVASADGLFKPHHLHLLEDFFKERDFPYYKLIRNGVRFCEYVGVLQIGPMVIEVLPKADKNSDKDHWRKLLIGMLLEVGAFRVRAPSSSSMLLKANSILDLYFELFVNEVEYLLHRGLVKRYRQTEGNTNALKGSLQFGKHIQQNLVHQERFFVRYQTYDTQHRLHGILYKAIRLLRQINTKVALNSRIGALMLHFPPMPDVAVNESLFEKLEFDRKDEHYQTAIDIARLLLLNYHPDISRGRNHVLALMFDMNRLWEQFVYVALRQKMPGRVKEQVPRRFWEPQNGRGVGLRPDIVIDEGMEHCMVLDAKWKNLAGINPSPEDLRQLFVYGEYFNAIEVALVYPGSSETSSGHYHGKIRNARVIGIPCIDNIKEWMGVICKQICA